MFCRGVAKGKIGETMVGLTKIITKFTDISIKMVAEGTVDVRDFQKKIGIIYRIKQICRFTILNMSFEFSRVFCKFLIAKTLAQLTPSLLKNWEEQFFKM